MLHVDDRLHVNADANRTSLVGEPSDSSKSSCLRRACVVYAQADEQVGANVVHQLYAVSSSPSTS